MLDSLEAPIRAAIEAAYLELPAGNVKKLTGRPARWRLRPPPGPASTWRVIFERDDRARTIRVGMIERRDKVYRQR